MSKAVVVYFSGYGHTKRVAEAAAEGAQAALIEIDGEGKPPEAGWGQLDEAQLLDKAFGCITNSASLNGDKQVSP